MLIKNSDLQLLTDGLNEAAKLKSKENAFKVAYNIGKSLRFVASALTDYEKARLFLIETHAIKDENGVAKKTPSEDGKEFIYTFEKDVQEKINSELFDLANMEVEVKVLGLTMEEMSSIEGITGEVIYKLENFIKE